MKKLIYIATGLPVSKGDITKTLRGETVVVRGWTLPRHSGSTGRVSISGLGAAPDGAAESYPSVIGAEWRFPMPKPPSASEREKMLRRIESLEPSEAKMLLLMAFEWIAGAGVSTSQELETWLDEQKYESEAGDAE